MPRPRPEPCPPASCEQPFTLALTAPQAVGRTSAAVLSPAGEPARRTLVLGHSAGSDRGDGVLTAVARGLASRGTRVVVFNFPYAEAGRRLPDRLPRLVAAFRDVADAVRGRFDDGPLLLGGRSLGGRVASLLAADGDDCAGLLLLGYPLHPAGRLAAGGPATRPAAALRTGHWPRLRRPVLFVQGDRDRLCDLDLLERERAALRVEVAVHVVAGADHSFGVRVRDGRSRADVLDEVVNTVDGWLADLAVAVRP